ncbi:MAG: hypothetical protein WBH58_03015 [Bacteroidales bacterium]|mgnify:FL=1|jgi:16S rRNA C967 or C1407 C5-methylase (RsmB/RsmF family)|nr:hypothetical protein [Bacteroidales bacterium]MDI9574887.1 hypothetical protein [Bacteroidota bacterium]MDY0401312.1 hypothetical protein [Bacteroidales bacterium]HOB77929.1 hypothetical protein [Bacteroidales bacterium]HPZ61107.1 hypothetical protein [Bacteroidales bacterium]
MIKSEFFDIIIKSINRYYDINHKEFLYSFNEKPHIAIKVNPYKKINQLFDLLHISDEVSWCSDAYYLSDRPDFYKDPLLYAGAYYVMDPASMFIDYIFKNLQLSNDIKVLDIAAAPGGKSIIVNSNLSNNAVLWSNDTNSNRAKTLNYNLIKWGRANNIVSNAKISDFHSLQNQFDLVILDAPCTGSGFYRKYENWQEHFSIEYIKRCANRQKEILKDLIPIIPLYGYLIYSTCSYTSEENEDIAKWLISHGFEEVHLSIPDQWGIIKSKYGYRFFPHLTKSEGFYYVILRKIENKQSKFQNFNYNKKNQSSIRLQAPPHIDFENFIDFNDEIELKKIRQNISLISSSIAKWMDWKGFFFNGKVLNVGTTFIHENKKIPSPQFALSIYTSNSIPQLHLNISDALSYLQKKSFKLNTDKGIYLVKYLNLALGWIKIIDDDRFNNYFPVDWRIINM